MELAVFSDCRSLIESFVRSGDSRFESFCQQWKTIMFQHIFSAQSTNIELMQTTAAVLHIAKRIVCGRDRYARPNSENMYAQQRRRIGGMFLMYTIYFKQPLEQYMKVEVCPGTWQEIKEFIAQLPAEQNDSSEEVRFIYLKLLESNAFRFSAADYCVGLENLVDFDKIDEHLINGGQCSSRLRQDLPVLSETTKLLPALNVLEEGYNEMKEMLTKVGRANAQALPPTTIFNDIKTVFGKIQNILQEPKSIKMEDPQTKVESKRRSLKRKGYSGMNTSVRSSDQNVANEKNLGNGESSTSKSRRMSSRTVFSEPLPEEMLRDLQEQADSNEDEEDEEQEISTLLSDDDGED